jgi:hypothetical protein
MMSLYVLKVNSLGCKSPGDYAKVQGLFKVLNALKSPAKTLLYAKSKTFPGYGLPGGRSKVVDY